MQTEQRAEMIRRMRIRSVRMQNMSLEMNRQNANGDLYSDTQEDQSGSLYGSLRLRILIAMLLFLLFFFMEYYGLSIGDVTASRVMEQLDITMELPVHPKGFLPWGNGD
ncbi:MAG: hypothetical protein IJC59_01930 [Lachnospiraceae bacterium]|nr:hypothetical protein [Lachnospiraceae bacterium]